SHGNPRPKRLWSQLDGIGLDLQKVEAAMQSQEVLENVRRDVEEGRLIGVNKTPTFYINGNPLRQFGYQQLLDQVAYEVKNAY
ncbi:MAG: DsbA family protein, partial [Woeseiaceae bacterium]